MASQENRSLIDTIASAPASHAGALLRLPLRFLPLLALLAVLLALGPGDAAAQPISISDCQNDSRYLSIAGAYYLPTPSGNPVKFDNVTIPEGQADGALLNLTLPTEIRGGGDLDEFIETSSLAVLNADATETITGLTASAFTGHQHLPSAGQNFYIILAATSSYNPEAATEYLIKASNLKRGTATAELISCVTFTVKGLTGRPEVVISKSALTIRENGSGDYTVKLGAAPSSDVSITVTSGDTGAAKVKSGSGTAGDTTTLTFTAANYDTEQTVTVSGVDDSDDSVPSRMATISHSVTSDDLNYKGGQPDSVSVTVKQTNRAPVITTPNPFNVSIQENQATQALATLSATDADGDTITWKLTGTDAGCCQVSNAGVLSVPTALVHSTKSSYSFTAQASDGNGGTDTITVNLTVTTAPVTNQAPVISSGAGGTLNLEVSENVSNVALATLSATDPDGDGFSWSLSGADAGPFRIDRATGALSLSTALDYEVKKSYSFEAQASDGKTGGTASITVNVAVIDAGPPGVMDPPRVVGRTPTSLSFAWDPPGSYGRPITSYRLFYKNLTTLEHKPFLDVGLVTRYTLRGLRPGASYVISVRAVSVEGPGGWSESLVVSTPGTSSPTAAPPPRRDAGANVAAHTGAHAYAGPHA